MFTGLVEAMGRVEALRRSAGGATLRVRHPLAAPRKLALGESIAVDGCCLTVTASGAGWFECLAAPETLARTGIGTYRAGTRVNLERAMSGAARFGGHIVQGHVDGRIAVTSVRREGESIRLRFELPDAVRGLIVEKGSVALDGVSLTVAAAAPDWFEVMLIPHTRQVTNLGERRAGDRLNLEIDVIAKYVQSLMAAQLAAVARRRSPK